MPETIIIKPSIAAQFQRFLQQERVLFFSAPCGFGKTVLAEALLDSMPGNSMDRYRGELVIIRFRLERRLKKPDRNQNIKSRRKNQ